MKSKHFFVIWLSAFFLLISSSAYGQLTFFAWSDQHIQTDGTGTHAADAIDAMNAMAGMKYPASLGDEVARPEFVMGLGDITEWPSNAALKTYINHITNRLVYPSYDIAGNHDSGGKSPRDIVHNWLIRRHGSLRYSFDLGGVHFVMVYSEYDDTLNNPAQDISKEALTYIKEDLKRVDKAVPVIVATHLCLDSITNRDALIDALGDANILCVLGGHYHKSQVARYRGVNFIQIPSPAPNSADEFTVIRIEPGRLVAVPYDYRNKKWVTREGKVLDIPIRGPSKKAEVNTPSSATIKTLQIGDTAPDFSLEGVGGKVHSLRDYSEYEVLAVVFTCNHCPTAQAYEERIKKITADYKDKGVAVVAVSPNDPLSVRLDELGYTDISDTLEDMKIRAKDADFNFPYLYDGENQAVSRAYGPMTTPHVFLFDKNRRLRYAGRIDNDEHIGKAAEHNMRDALDAMLAGKEVAVKTTRTFGCSIKWADKRKNVKRAFETWAKEPVELKEIDKQSVLKLIDNDSENLRLINFWATWCGGCVAEFPDLIEINRMYRNRQFEMITVSLDQPDKKSEALAFLKKQQASCSNYIYDSLNRYELIDAVSERYNWPGPMPFTLIIKPGGEIMAGHVGMIDPLEVKKQVVGYLGRHYK